MVRRQTSTENNDGKRLASSTLVWAQRKRRAIACSNEDDRLKTGAGDEQDQRQLDQDQAWPAKNGREANVPRRA